MCQMMTIFSAIVMVLVAGNIMIVWSLILI